MSDLPNRVLFAQQAHIPDCVEDCADSRDVLNAWLDGDLLTREEAANTMMAFFDQFAGDVGQRWPTTEDALKWLETDHE